jgi:hypothetical protein
VVIFDLAPFDSVAAAGLGGVPEVELNLASLSR